MRGDPVFTLVTCAVRDARAQPKTPDAVHFLRLSEAPPVR